MNLEQKVKELEEKLAVYENSPYKDAYLGVLKQIETCNKDLIDTPAGLRDEEDAKAFERYDKYILKVDEYYNKLELLRGKMSPEEKKFVDAKANKSKTIPI
jgi:hypothetical protein